MEKLKNSLLVLKSCYRVLLKDKELIFFPIFSGAIAAFVFFILLSLFYSPYLYPSGVEVLKTNPLFYGLQPYLHWFFIIFAVRFVIIFFGACITASVARRFSGENPTIASDILDALKHLKKIMAWAFLVSIFIFIINLFKNRGWLQKIIGDVVEITVDIACFFVIPVMIIENANPMEAIKRSVQLLRDSWGEQIAGNVSFYLLVSLIQIPGIILFILAFKIDMTAPDPMKAPLSIDFFNLSLAGIYIAFTFAMYYTLKEIFRTALYIYARDKKVPAGFEATLLEQAFA
jgi:hypothetical protein